MTYTEGLAIAKENGFLKEYTEIYQNAHIDTNVNYMGGLHVSDNTAVKVALDYGKWLFIKNQKKRQMILWMTGNGQYAYYVVDDEKLINPLIDYLNRIFLDKHEEGEVYYFTADNSSEELFQQSKKGAVKCKTIHQLIDWINSAR